MPRVKKQAWGWNKKPAPPPAPVRTMPSEPDLTPLGVEAGRWYRPVVWSSKGNQLLPVEMMPLNYEIERVFNYAGQQRYLVEMIPVEVMT